jgi:hypothetical protein
MSTLPCMRPDSPRQTIIDRLVNAQGYLGSAQSQRAPSDDAIICQCIDNARRSVIDVIHELERGGAIDPVITWPRPDWYEPAHGRPVDGPGMRGDDALPCDVEKGDAS